MICLISILVSELKYENVRMKESTLLEAVYSLLSLRTMIGNNPYALFPRMIISGSRSTRKDISHE